MVEKEGLVLVLKSEVFKILGGEWNGEILVRFGILLF